MNFRGLLSTATCGGSFRGLPLYLLHELISLLLLLLLGSPLLLHGLLLK